MGLPAGWWEALIPSTWQVSPPHCVWFGVTFDAWYFQFTRYVTHTGFTVYFASGGPPGALRGPKDGAPCGTPVARQLVACDALEILSHCKFTNLAGGFGSHCVTHTTFSILDGVLGIPGCRGTCKRQVGNSVDSASMNGLFFVLIFFR